MKGSIILLNGASSAGKSTIASAIQAAADRPILRMSLDLFFFGSVLPSRRDGQFDWKFIRPRLVAGYYRSLAAFAESGNDLVVDHVIESQSDFDALTSALDGIDVVWVGVHCPIEELERRERERGDRRLGDARKDLDSVHSFCRYDVEVDSTRLPKENAHVILRAWTARNRAD